MLMNFFGILNDNFLKKLFAFISIYWVIEDDKNFLIGLAGLLFILPYIFFSPFAGFLAKVYYKKKIVVLFKILELPVLAIGIAGFFFENMILVYVSIFLMGLQSCLFSPAKYGLIRDVGGTRGISFGTGAFEMTAFLGNLFGVVIAGLVADLTSNREIVLTILFVLIAVAGYFSAIFIKPNESDPDNGTEKPNFNPVSFLLRSHKWSRSVKGLNSVVFSLGLFWFAAAMIEMVIANHCPNVLNMSMTDTGILMAMVAISIALGTFISGVVSGKKVELSLVPLGALGFAVNMALISIIQPERELFSVLIILAAFFAGLYKIPLNAFIQERVEGRKLGDIIAYNNTVVFIFILFGAIVLMLFESTNHVFLAITIVTALMLVNGLVAVKEIRLRTKEILGIK